MAGNARRIEVAKDYCEQHFVLKKTDYTFTEALKHAGYGDRYIQSFGARIWKCIVVQDIVKEYESESKQETQDQIDYIRADHKRLQRIAEKKGDLATATANSVWYGKTYAAYTDVMSTGEERKEQQVLTEAEQAEIKRLTGVRLADMHKTA